MEKPEKKERRKGGQEGREEGKVRLSWLRRREEGGKGEKWGGYG